MTCSSVTLLVTSMFLFTFVLVGKTKNIQSAIVFKAIPLACAMSCLILFLGQIGVLTL
jgi:hypothetical protein